MNNQNIQSVLVEERSFTPSAEFTAKARLKPEDVARMRADAASNYKGFWARQAQSELRWHKPFTTTLDESRAPNYRWFTDGELNVSWNCLDVHLEERGHKTAPAAAGYWRCQTDLGRSVGRVQGSLRHRARNQSPYRA